MVIDFHIHGKLSSKINFDEEEFLRKVNEAKQEGLDTLVLTEHSHADNFTEAYSFLDNNFKYVHDYYNVNGVKIFTGVEVTTDEKLDILFVGERDRILEFNKKILNEREKQEFIKIDDLFNLLSDESFLVILAHPYRKHEEFPNINKDILDRIDAIEFNAKDLYNSGIEEMKYEVIKLSKVLNKSITGGSDSHYYLQIGSIKNKFNIDCNTVKELREQIRLNNYIVEISNDLSIRVRASKIIKKLIKGSK